MSPSLEIAVRVSCFAVVFAGMALWERFAPRRRLTVGRRPRWAGNLGILAIDIVAVRLLVPTAAVGVALIAAARGWGLFNLLGLPVWAAIPVGVVALDLVITSSMSSSIMCRCCGGCTACTTPISIST